MKTLTDEQLNLELCKWLGWTKTESNSAYWLDGEWTFDIPDHINDLSSLGRIALIEAKLTDEQWDEYSEWLIDEVEIDRAHINAAKDTQWERRKVELRKLISATARQRVTAILRTVNPEVFQ